MFKLLILIAVINFNDNTIRYVEMPVLRDNKVVEFETEKECMTYGRNTWIALKYYVVAAKCVLIQSKD